MKLPVRVWMIWGGSALILGALLAPEPPIHLSKPVAKPEELPQLPPTPYPLALTAADLDLLAHSSIWGKDKVNSDGNKVNDAGQWQLIGTYRRAGLHVAIFANRNGAGGAPLQLHVGDRIPNSGARILAIEREKIALENEHGDKRWLYVQRQTTTNLNATTHDWQTDVED